MRTVLQIRQTQLDAMAHNRLKHKLHQAFSRDVPDFSALSPPSQSDFLEDAMAGASAHGLETQQGVASWALALWFLEPGFERKSAALQVLLGSTLPEIRKLYAMNEWVSILVDDPGDLAFADAVLAQAVTDTAAWGEGR